MEADSQVPAGALGMIRRHYFPSLINFPVITDRSQRNKLFLVCSCGAPFLAIFLLFSTPSTPIMNKKRRLTSAAQLTPPSIDDLVMKTEGYKDSQKGRRGVCFLRDLSQRNEVNASH